MKQISSPCKTKLIVGEAKNELKSHAFVIKKEGFVLVGPSGIIFQVLENEKEIVQSTMRLELSSKISNATKAANRLMRSANP